MKTNEFDYKPERRLNPYIGFTTFQHFSGEPIYSDSIVRPENNMCETEDFETYPVPETVEEKGDSQGFYPDGSVAYIRFLWKEFEPEKGFYNYAFIENILKKGREHNQHVILRIMAHSTCARDDVPEWLKSIVDCPERPDGKRVKDSPTDPRFFELFLEAVRKIGERFDGDSTLYAIDISLPGAWGEGHKLHLYSDDILERTVDVYTSVFKKTMLFGQVGRPELLKYANKSTRCGWRGDGFGDPLHIDELYPPKIEKVEDMWKTVPVSFESYWWLGEWQRQGWDIDTLIDRSLRWHVSTFNGKSIPIPFEWREKVDEWISKMGYHFVIDSFSFPERAVSGDTVTFKLCVTNRGVAPIYTKIPLVIKLTSTENEVLLDTATDITKWLPGSHEEEIAVKLPSEMKNGKYKIALGICGKELPSVVFCSDAPFDGDFSVVGETEIV